MTMMMKATSTKRQISKFQSTVLRPRSKGKSKKARDFIEVSRGLDSREQSMELNSTVIDIEDDDNDAEADAACCSSSSELEEKSYDELGFRASKDVVWAKAYPHTWWPGWIQKEYRSKFLVSFFECERSLWFHESEMRRFGSDFEPAKVSKNIRGPELDQDAVDSALAEYGRRLLSELTCSCQDEFNERQDSAERSNIEVMKAFNPVGVLDMVQNIAVSPSFEEMDPVSVVKAAAHVNAFRYYAFIKRDWIYEETMRLSEALVDSDANLKSTSPEQDIKCVLNSELEYYTDEEKEDGGEENKEGKEEKGEEEEGNHNGTICSLNSEVGYSEEEEEEEEEEDKEGKEEEDKDKEDSNHDQYVEQIGINLMGCKKNNNGLIEEEDSLRRLKIAANMAFQPVKILAFVHRMAVSTWVEDEDTNNVIKAASQVNRFRRYRYIKNDSNYRNIMRLSESTDDPEANLKSASCEDEKTCGVVQSLRLSDDEEVNSHKLVDEGLKSNPVTCKNVTEGPLCDTLNHVYCLAVDPFFSGAQRSGMKNLDPMCQRVLSYRKLIHQKMVDLNPHLKHRFYDDCVPDTSKVQKLSSGNSILHHLDVSDGIDVEESRSIAYEDKNEESELLIKLWNKRKKRARVEEKTEDVNINRSVSNTEDVSEAVSRDRSDCKRDRGRNKRLKTKNVNVCLSSNHVESRDVEPYVTHCNGGSDSNKRLKTEDVKLCSTSNMTSDDAVDASKDTLDCHLESSKRQEPDGVDVCCSIANEGGYAVDELRDPCNFTSESERNKRQKIFSYDSALKVQRRSTKMLDDNHESNIAPYVLKDHLNIKHHREAGNSRRTEDLKVGCSLNLVSDKPGETMSEEITGSRCDDEIRVAKRQCSSFGHRSHKNVDFLLSSDSASDISYNQPTIISGGISKGTGRPSRHIIERIVKLPQAKPLPPLTSLYVSPLSSGSPASSGIAQFQPSKSHTDSGYPVALHMKFPKDFKLPSKEELVKKFRPFGPIDYLKTKVFFYTGSAQVIFQHNLDAEAACHCAKVKKIFGENVRFWLAQREQSRRGSTETSAPSPLPRVGSSIPDLKSCLKISNPQGNKAERKGLHVKFPSGNQALQTVTSESQNEVLTQSNSYKYSNDLRPDISLQMYVLLEKCNQMVTQIKDNLGIQSFYTLFTHNFCDTKFDER